MLVVSLTESLTEGAVQKATLNGLEAIQFEAAATVAGTSIHMLFVCFLFEERGWYAQFACVDELWDGLQGTMEKALASMKVCLDLPVRCVPPPPFCQTNAFLPSLSVVFLLRVWSHSPLQCQ